MKSVINPNPKKSQKIFANFFLKKRQKVRIKPGTFFKIFEKKKCTVIAYIIKKRKNPKNDWVKNGNFLHFDYFLILKFTPQIDPKIKFKINPKIDCKISHKNQKNKIYGFFSLPPPPHPLRRSSFSEFSVAP